MEPGEDDDDAGDEELEDGDEAAQRPRTQAEMAKLRSNFKNNMELANTFLADRNLQLEFRIIWNGTRHITKLYKQSLEAGKGGQDCVWGHYNIIFTAAQLYSSQSNLTGYNSAVASGEVERQQLVSESCGTYTRKQS